MEITRKIGEVFGRCVVSLFVKSLRKKVEGFQIQYSGIQFLKEMEDRPYLLAANHIKPVERKSQESGLSQDVFVLSRIILEQTGRQPRIISKSDNGWWSKNLFFRFWQRMCQPFGDGMSKGMGMIPIRKNPGSLNRYFLKLIESAVRENELILIFPEGNWYQDFSPTHKLETGAVHLALKHNLPIVPAYVRGCDSWKPQGKIDVAFGASFKPYGKTKEEITTEIRERITALQKQVVQ